MATKEEKIITHISNFRKVKRIPDIIKIFIIFKRDPAKLMMVEMVQKKKKAEYLCQELEFWIKLSFGNSNEIDKILSYTDLFYCLRNRKFWTCRT
jgi:hypothetical protein